MCCLLGPGAGAQYGGAMLQYWTLRCEPLGLQLPYLLSRITTSSSGPPRLAHAPVPAALLHVANSWHSWSARAAAPDANPHPTLPLPAQPHFREQFEISHPTPRYSGLLSMLPSVLVASAEQITALVQLLCAEMSLAFEHHGLSLPPWRQSKSLLSK